MKPPKFFPLPWSEANGDVFDAEGKPVETTKPVRAFVLAAVNSHVALTEIAERYIALDDILSPSELSDACDALAVDAEAALAMAKGGET